MVMKKLIIVLLGFSSCAFASEALCSGVPKDPTIIKAVKWYRDSAEQKALYREVFSAGQDYITQQAQKLEPNTWGVVLDIDETTLNNTWYFKQCTETAPNEKDFSKY